MRNKKLVRIKKIRGQVLGLEMALKLIEDDLDVVLDRLIFLLKVEEDLVYNIDLHRSNKVITVVSEYKKSIQELGNIRKEIIKHKNLKSRLQKKLEKKLESYSYYIDELEAAYKDLEAEQVILLFDRDKDGK